MGTGTEWSKGSSREYDWIGEKYNDANPEELDSMLNEMSQSNHVRAVLGIQPAVKAIESNWYGSNDENMWPVTSVLSGDQVKQVLVKMGELVVHHRKQGNTVEFFCRCGNQHLEVAVLEPKENLVKVYISTPFNSGYDYVGATMAKYDKATNELSAALPEGKLPPGVQPESNLPAARELSEAEMLKANIALGRIAYAMPEKDLAFRDFPRQGGDFDGELVEIKREDFDRFPFKQNPASASHKDDPSGSGTWITFEKRQDSSAS